MYLCGLIWFYAIHKRATFAGWVFFKHVEPYGPKQPPITKQWQKRQMCTARNSAFALSRMKFASINIPENSENILKGDVYLF